MSPRRDFTPGRMPAPVGWHMAIRNLRRYYAAKGEWPTLEQLAKYDQRRSPTWWHSAIRELVKAGAVRRWMESADERDARFAREAVRGRVRRRSRGAYRFAVVDEKVVAVLTGALSGVEVEA